jgi:hypothetical protein
VLSESSAIASANATNAFNQTLQGQLGPDINLGEFLGLKGAELDNISNVGEAIRKLSDKGYGHITKCY